MARLHCHGKEMVRISKARTDSDGTWRRTTRAYFQKPGAKRMRILEKRCDKRPGYRGGQIQTTGWKVRGWTKDFTTAYHIEEVADRSGWTVENVRHSPEPKPVPESIPCPACADTLAGHIDESGRCVGCGHYFGG